MTKDEEVNALKEAALEELKGAFGTLLTGIIEKHDDPLGSYDRAIADIRETFALAVSRL